VETRTVEQTEPADPAVSESHETIVQKAGQVWYPDSAYKTAQAIQDFDHEGLPLLIFANWRGFSGGLRDLFDEILKFGSYIVDNLRVYNQPVFIYLPPNGELRGGAWVVLDPTINPDNMEMYCDENARGGVLEPSGTVEIKFKERDVLKTRHRLDEKLTELNRQLNSKANPPTQADAKSIKTSIVEREKELMPIYEQVAVTFADLHDTPGRMLAKGCISEVLSWKTSRAFFYYCLKRKMEEMYIKDRIRKASPNLKNSAILETIQSWLSQTGTNNNDISTMWKDHKFMINWFQTQDETIQHKISSIRASYLKGQSIELAKENPLAVMEGLLQVITSLEPSQKEGMFAKLKELLK